MLDLDSTLNFSEWKTLKREVGRLITVQKGHFCITVTLNKTKGYNLNQFLVIISNYDKLGHLDDFNQDGVQSRKEQRRKYKFWFSNMKPNFVSCCVPIYKFPG